MFVYELITYVFPLCFWEEITHFLNNFYNFSLKVKKWHHVKGIYMRFVSTHSTHTLMHTYTHAHIHSCTHTLMHSYTHADIHSSTHTLKHTYTQAHIHSCTHTLMHAYTQAHTHSCTHTLIHILTSVALLTSSDSIFSMTSSHIAHKMD